MHVFEDRQMLGFLVVFLTQLIHTTFHLDILHFSDGLKGELIYQIRRTKKSFTLSAKAKFFREIKLIHDKQE